jgi:hypothetical protein
MHAPADTRDAINLQGLGAARDARRYAACTSLLMMKRIICLYGPPCAGKSTVGRALADISGFYLVHNHLTSDIISRHVPRNFPDGSENLTFRGLKHDLRLFLVDQLLSAGIDGIIFTFVFSLDRGLPFVERFLNTIRSHHAGVNFVRLRATLEQILSEVENPDRVGTEKLHTREALLRVATERQFLHAIPTIGPHLCYEAFSPQWHQHPKLLAEQIVNDIGLTKC